ncbi:MAG: hypothetical protein AB1744_07015, partial [Candidatus Zixiibacteriota bacterium]
MSRHNWRIILTAVLIILGCIAFWHTFRLWTMGEEAKAELQDRDPGALLDLQQKAIRLGLDLQGGIHVVLRVKMEELDAGGREDAVERAIQIIRNRVDGLGVAEPAIQKQGRDRIIVDLPGYTDAERAEELIGQTALLEFKLMETYDNAALILTKIDSVVHEYEKARSGEVGVDSLDTTEVASEDTTMLAEAETADTTEEVDVLAELMGDSVIDTAELFGFDEEIGLDENERPVTSRLQAALPNSRTGANWPGFSVAKRDRELLVKWLNLPQVRDLIPIDIQFAWSTRPEIRDNREVYMLYLLKRKVQFVGKYLENIALGRDPYGANVVNFAL